MTQLDCASSFAAAAAEAVGQTAGAFEIDSELRLHPANADQTPDRHAAAPPRIPDSRDLRLQPTNPAARAEGRGQRAETSAAAGGLEIDSELRLQPTNARAEQQSSDFHAVTPHPLTPSPLLPSALIPPPSRTRGRPARTSLSDQQYVAIEQIALGFSDRVVAEKVGVHRVTITKWRLYHVLFRAELAARREQIFAEDRAQVREMFKMAMAVLSQQMQSANPVICFRAAKAVMSWAGKLVMQDRPQDSSDPNQILIQHARHIKRANASRDPAQQPVEDYEMEEAAADLEGKLNRPVRGVEEEIEQVEAVEEVTARVSEPGREGDVPVRSTPHPASPPSTGERSGAPREAESAGTADSSSARCEAESFGTGDSSGALRDAESACRGDSSAR